MNIIITGGAGFIGSHLIEHLCTIKKIRRIIAIDNLNDGTKKNLFNALKSPKVKLYKLDIRNLRSIINVFKNINVVIHLAAMSDIVPSIEEPIEYFETNFNGTLNVLEAMKKNKVNKIIYAASSSCYGIPKKIPTKENDQINTMYPYAFSKYIGEQLIDHYQKVYKINYLSLRLFNVYGTRSRTNSAYGAALGVFLKQKLENKPFTIVGSGKQKRDFVHVKDVCDAFKKAIFSNAKNEILNVGFGIPKSVNELVKFIGGKKIFIPKRPGEPNITHANIMKIKSKLKWEPKITLKEGINDVLKNISYWKNSTLWDAGKIKKATKNWFKYLK
jgi:UDP-glucose 4-epimerase